jgi:hypothetical protein
MNEALNSTQTLPASLCTGPLFLTTVTITSNATDESDFILIGEEVAEYDGDREAYVFNGVGVRAKVKERHAYHCI